MLSHLLISIALLSTPTFGQDSGATSVSEPGLPSAPQATVTADGEARDPLKVICRKAPPPTGTRVRTSRTRQQICMTQADWDLLAQDAQDATRDMDNPTANEEFLGPRQ